jgi:hypothetical protein
MKIEESESIVMMTLIAKREEKGTLLSALLESGIHLSNVSYGRGFVRTGYVKYSFGMSRDIRTVIIFCVSTDTKINMFLERLLTEFNFDKPHTGIAYTVPINQISY